MNPMLFEDIDLSIFNFFFGSNDDKKASKKEKKSEPKKEKKEEKKIVKNNKEETNNDINKLQDKNKKSNKEIEYKSVEEIAELISTRLLSEYEGKVKDVPKEVTDEFEKAISLRVIDTYWMEHINTMSHLREGIHLRSYAQNNPLQAYKTEGYELFDNLLAHIDEQITTYLLKAEVRQNTERKDQRNNTIVHDTHIKQKGTPIKKDKKIGRNDPCPCGSGKKYKQCCGK